MMYSIRLCHFIVSLLFLSGSWVDAECYFPNKSIAPNYQACDPAQVNGTACCELSTSVCSKFGYCYGNSRYIYRGGCTDPDWASPNCAKNCLNNAPGSFSNIYPCSSGVYTEYFCCGAYQSTPEAWKSCCGNSFKYTPGEAYVALSNVQDDTSTSTLSASSSTSASTSSLSASLSTSASTSTFSASSSTSTSLNTQTSSSIAASTYTALSASLTHAPTPSSHTTFKNTTTIELGVGIPLGLLLLLSLGFLFHRERQRRSIIENLKREHQATLSKVWQQQPRGRYPLVSDPADIQELENTHPAAGELDPQSGPIYEAAANR